MSVTWFEDSDTSNNRMIRQHQGGDDDSSSSSSIGNNSDSSAGAGDDSDDDASTTAFSCAALEQALPIKRGISTFYAGKSKSYQSLSDAVSIPSIHDIVKRPQHASAYNRKRKNILPPPHSHSHPPPPNFTSRPPSHPPLPRHPTNHPSPSPRRIYSSPCRSFSLSDLHHASPTTSSTSLQPDD